MNRFVLLALAAAPAFAVQVPTGTELSVRLNDKVASEVKTPQNFKASLIAPVVMDGTVVLPAGLTLSGSVKQARAADGKEAAQLELRFTSITDGRVTISMQAGVSGLENARETLDDKGVITGIDVATSYGGRLSEGLSKLGANEKLAGLAGVLQQAKQALNIQDVNGTSTTIQESS